MTLENAISLTQIALQTDALGYLLETAATISFMETKTQQKVIQ